ncbi:MAG: type II secretion system secretin GspD [Polyangia bacterium]|jgi:general secretion pathway protein D
MKPNSKNTDAGGRATLADTVVGRLRSALARTGVVALVAYLVASLAATPWAYAQAPAAATPPAPPQRPSRLVPRAPARPGTPAAAPAPPPPAPPAAPAAGAAKPGAPGVVELPGEKEFNSCKKLPPGKRIVKLNLKPETDVIDLIGWISSITCSQFLVSIPLQGKKVTVIAPQLITPEEAYRLFFAALESVGLTVEPSGKFLRIVESSRARFTSLPFVGANERVPHDKRYVTKLVRVAYLDTNDLTNAVLNRLKSETGDIISYRSSLIISDQAENIDRLVSIIKQFDTPSANRDKIWMIRIKNTSAIDMAGRIAEIMPVQQLGTGQKRPPGSPPPTPPKPQPGPPGDLSTEMTITKIVPDERSNSLIVVANQRAYDWLVSLVHKLDVSPEESVRGAAQDRFHIYNCANANCDELAATLSAITGVQVVGSLSTGVRRRGSTTAPTAAPPAQNQQGNQSALMFEGDVRVTFDAPTNSLLVMSSFKDFQALRRVIEKLDAPRKQVFIEALILEVTTDKSNQTGISYHAGKGQDIAGQQGLLLGGFNASQTLGAATNPATFLNSMGGLSAALFGPAISSAQTSLFGVVNVNIPSFGVFLQILQTNNDVNVLSNPHILIMNNQEGEITVGENLPFPGAMMGTALTGGATGYTPYLSVNRQDVALKLKLLPSVNEHNVIRLDVEQEVSDVEAPNYNNLGPATSKRSTKTTVVARDQQTVVIGGLMSDRASETVTKVPILGDIPVIGFFFRNTQKDLKKTNILIAITPYVISDLSDLRRVAEKKMRERREFIERYSSLQDRVSLDKDLDFRRKRGMLEEINKTVRDMEEEEAELRGIRDRDEGEDSTPIEPVSVKDAPAPVPEAEEPGPAAPADDITQEPPAEERLTPASPPAPAPHKATGKGRTRRKTTATVTNKAQPTAPPAAPESKTAPVPPAVAPAPPGAAPVKPAPPPAKE